MKKTLWTILAMAAALCANGGVQLWENGPIWAECNIGATRPEDYGYYFWWGDTIGYKRENNAWVASDGSTANFSFVQSNAPTDGKNNADLLSAGYIDSTGNLVSAHDAATSHLGSFFRMPTHAEFVALIDNCTTTWMTTNGVYGRLVTGKGDYADKSIFLPAAGDGGETYLYSDGVYGYYWSSSPYSSDNTGDARNLELGAGYFECRVRSRYIGRSVRPICVPVNFIFVSGDATIGTASSLSSSSTALEAPIAPRHGDDRFLGYFTAPTGGVKVFDENYDFVQASAESLSPDMTLYARWQPVASTPEGGITRLVYRGVLTNFGEWSSSLRKTMHVKVYESASAAEPLWSGDVADVPINPDGSFEAVFGNDELALAFASNNLTHVELTVGEALSPLAPRRAFASVASVNRALVAEGAASDIKVGTLGANAIVAEKITAGSLEASEMVRVEGSVSVEVKPFDIESRQETTIWRGAGVTAWGDSELIKKFDNVVAGQWLWTSDREGVVMIHATGKSRSTLRIPATIQFVRPGDEVRAPTWENGEVSVTVWGYKK